MKAEYILVVWALSLVLMALLALAMDRDAPSDNSDCTPGSVMAPVVIQRVW